MPLDLLALAGAGHATSLQYKKLFGKKRGPGIPEPGPWRPGGRIPTGQELVGQPGEDQDWADYLSEMMGRLHKNVPDAGDYYRKTFPFIAAQMLKTGPAKDLMDFQRLSQLTYQPGAGKIEAGATGSLRAARGALAASGLASSGAYPMLAAQTRMAAGGQKGAMLTGLLGQNLQNRYQIQRDILGLGMGMPSQQPGGSQDYSWLTGIGSGLGAFAGWYLSRPTGGGMPAYGSTPAGGKGGMY